MGELEEFAEALIDQIRVELDEEKEIEELAQRIAEDSDFDLEFEPLERAAKRIFNEVKPKIKEFTKLSVPDNVGMEFPELVHLKILKGRKVFATPDSRDFVGALFEAISREDKSRLVELIQRDTAKFLVYSTYAKSYISKITTTYGDYLDSKIYLNKFILSRYPDIILFKQGSYSINYDTVNSGYMGALKMTILEESIHSTQTNLHEINKKAVTLVNQINEELANTILNLDDNTAKELTQYLQLQSVPDDFPIARRANLFFMLNPDNFIMNVLGPDVLTFTKVEIDPHIAQSIPSLADIYQRWLKPIQEHEAVFATMEGMAEFCVQNILKDDKDFAQYLGTFMGTDLSTYMVRKSMGKDFVHAIYEKHGSSTFETIIQNPPTTRQLKEPQLYLNQM